MKSFKPFAQAFVSIILNIQFGASLEVWVWANDGCNGTTPLYHDLLGPKNGCQVRNQPRKDLQGANSEVAVSVAPHETSAADESQFIVFFKGNTCEPNTMINFTDLGCSTLLNGQIGEYQSWEIWDMCEGKVGCSFDKAQEPLQCAPDMGPACDGKI